MEKLQAESWPGCRTAAYPYLPAVPASTPPPLGLLLCGYAYGGKDAPGYRAMARLLALARAAVLVIDNIVQGEHSPMGHWNVTGLLKAGLTQQGFHGREDGYLPTQLFSTANRRIARAYAALGAKDVFAAKIFSGGHSCHDERRLRMVAFLTPIFGLSPLPAEIAAASQEAVAPGPCYPAWPTRCDKHRRACRQPRRPPLGEPAAFPDFPARSPLPAGGRRPRRPRPLEQPRHDVHLPRPPRRAPEVTPRIPSTNAVRLSFGGEVRLRGRKVAARAARPRGRLAGPLLLAVS